MNGRMQDFSRFKDNQDIWVNPSNLVKYQKKHKDFLLNTY